MVLNAKLDVLLQCLLYKYMVAFVSFVFSCNYVLDTEPTFRKAQNAQFIVACMDSYIPGTILFKNVMSDDNLILHNLLFITAHISFIMAQLFVCSYKMYSDNPIFRPLLWLQLHRYQTRSHVYWINYGYQNGWYTIFMERCSSQLYCYYVGKQMLKGFTMILVL